MAGGLDTERTVHRNHDRQKGPENDPRKGWKEREKRKSDSIGQKNGSWEQTVTKENHLTPTGKRGDSRITERWQETWTLNDNGCTETDKQTARSGVTRRQKAVNGYDQEPSGRHGARGVGRKHPPPPAGVRVGDGVTSSGGGKGLDSRIPSSPPGVGS